MTDVPETHPRYESLRLRDAVVAGVDLRHGLERGRERQGPAFFDLDVLDVRRRHRPDVALPEQVADDARHEVLGGLLEDLIPQPLAHQPGRRLARPEPGDAHGAPVALREPFELLLDGGGGHLHRDPLADVAYVREVGFGH